MSSEFFRHVVESLIYSVIGIVIFAALFLIVCRVTPFSIRKEIEEDQNTALGIIIASLVIGTALIIASAIQG